MLNRWMKLFSSTLAVVVIGCTPSGERATAIPPQGVDSQRADDRQPGTGITLPVTGDKDADMSLDSREYKLMLDPKQFAGYDPTPALSSLETDLLDRMVRSGLELETNGTVTALRAERTVKFYDTPGECALRERGFIFRERSSDGDREVTLKFRSPDRYVAASHDLDASRAAAEHKFEEDIKPGFRSIFSQSNTAGIGSRKRFDDIGDLADLFEGIEQADIPNSTPLAVVAGAPMYEYVFGRRIFDLGDLTAEMSVTLWYLDPADTEPAVAELSFKYEEDERDLDPESVATGIRLFERMTSLGRWVADDSPTKTAFVYSIDPTFCD